MTYSPLYRRRNPNPPPPAPSRDDEILAALKASIETRGRMPTLKELCHDAKIWSGALARVLARLEAKGRLRRLPASTLRVELRETA